MLITTSDWINKTFAAGSHPTQKTVTRWIKNGNISGVIVGRKTYVDSDAIFNAQIKQIPTQAPAKIRAGKYTLKD